MTEKTIVLDNTKLFQTTRKIPRKLKKRLLKEACGYVPKKTPHKISDAKRAKRKAKRKAEKAEAAESRNIMMIEHLVKNGWQRSGPANDVWTLGAWKDGYEDCKTTLCKAYKIQLKLQGEGYVRPVGIDDAIEL
jgi:hypothetical protein